jgi:hypothetical protein
MAAEKTLSGITNEKDALALIGDQTMRRYLTTCPGCGDEALKVYEATDVIVAALARKQKVIEQSADALAKSIDLARKL